MAKKENFNSLSYYKNILRYRWEFVRRGIKYRNMVNNLRIKVKKKYIRKVLKEGIITRFPHYDIEFDKLYKIYFEKIVPYFRRDIKSDDSLYKRSNEFLTVFLLSAAIDPEGNICTIDQTRDKRRLIININITYPNELLIPILENNIKYYRNLLKPKRKRFEEYDKYLNVYDLKKKGWSWSKIAEKYSSNIVSFHDAQRKVMRYYKKSKELVNGGYRQIR